ncbi:MAG: winged helix DNA-binding protein [Euryarchaeota archaeon]|nr:winged helix DNA-binding protein [Euryarchaeota archaeon]
MVASELEDVFLHKMPTSLLLTIRTYDRTYVSVLAKECDCTYPHAVKTLWNMEKLGLVQSEKVGRVKYVRLTDRGKIVADSLSALVHSLGVNDAPRRDDVAYINQKINNVIHKVETIQKELEARDHVSREEGIRFNRRLGPYYRELNAIHLLLERQPTSPLRTKVDALTKTIDKLKKEIATRQVLQPAAI